MLAPDGVGDFGYVDGTLRVDGDAVRGDELSGAFPFVLVPELTHQFALQIEDLNAVSQAWGVVHPAHPVQFADVDVLTPEDH